MTMLLSPWKATYSGVPKFCVLLHAHQTLLGLFYNLRTNSRIAELFVWACNFASGLVHWGDDPCTDLV